MMLHPVSRSKQQFFSYRPLDFDDHEIRLLTLGSLSSNDSIISCSISHVSLISPGTYIALSYCWGDAASTETILLENERVPVTKNLASALRALQKQKKNDVRVWADAVCINQQNNEERSHQVRNMREIYSKASEVFCWVSEKSDPKLPRAIEYMLGIATHSKPDVLSEPELDASMKDQYWKSLIDIFREPYWRRVWIIQEVAVASKATMSFGNFTMGWETLAIILRLMKVDLSLHSDDQAIPEPSFLNAHHLLEIRERFLIKRDPLSLLEAIQLTQHTLATDPRDKIFALLGISHDGHVFVPVPNYKQPFEIVLTEMVKTMMAMDRCLNLIWVKGNFPKNSNLVLPSWVPHLHIERCNRLTFQETFQYTWQPLTNNSPVLLGSNTQYLRVAGRRLGYISQLTSKFDCDGTIEIPTSRPQWINLTSTLTQFNDSLRHPTHLEVQMQEFIWETITMARFRIDLLRSLFSSLWKPEGRGLIQNLALIAWIDKNAWFRITHWTLREWSQVTSNFILRRDQDGVVLRVMKSVSWETEPEGTTDDLLNLIDHLDKIIGSGMRLAVMTGHQSLAMVHPDSRENDELYLIRGSSVPVVLRTCLNENGKKLYSVVGGGYTLATDAKSEYYRVTKDAEDALNWDDREVEEVTLC